MLGRMGVDSFAGGCPDGLNCKQIRLTINKPDKIMRRIENSSEYRCRPRARPRRMSRTTPWRFAPPPLLSGNALPDQSGFPHKRHSDLRLAFSPLHREQRLYIFPVNHCVMRALPPRMTIRNNRLVRISVKSPQSRSDYTLGTLLTGKVSKPNRKSKY